MNIKKMIAEKEEARMEKMVNEMNGKKEKPDGRKVKLTKEQMADKKRAYQREWWAKKRAANKAKKEDDLAVNYECFPYNMGREVTSKALLGDQTAKADSGKPKISLVPMQILTDIAEVREYGNRKYHDPNNWKNVDMSRYVDAMLRHMIAFVRDPNGRDEESGIEHYKHLACNVAFICEMMEGKDA